jgi:hypothetical protein
MALIHFTRDVFPISSRRATVATFAAAWGVETIEPFPIRAGPILSDIFNGSVAPMI